MSTPKITSAIKAPPLNKGSAHVIGVTSKNGKPVLAETLLETASISGLDLETMGAKSSAEHVVRVPGTNGAVFALIGLGEDELSDETLRKLSGAALRTLSEFKDVTIGLPVRNTEQAVAVLEGALIGAYEFTSFKGTKKVRPLASITVVSPFKLTQPAIDEALVLAKSVNAVRDLANTPPNELFPQSMAAAFQKAAKGAGVTIEVWDEKRLTAEQMAGILAVGRGSVRPPRLVKIEYKPRGAKKSLALVGKGITFDSGGLTLKPGPGMIGMKYDMTGAATVGHAVLAIAALKLPVHVTAYLCIAENLPSGSATRPNDVIRYRNGKTVEVTNTDAEGRLVLADGLILASEQKPDLIIDVATLTGAARVALGNRYTGLMGNAEGIGAVKNAAEKSGELVWHMPLASELRTLLNSDVADMINSKLGDPTGGMMVGGIFLKEFVGTDGSKTKTPLAWAHLDIAGSANSDSAYGYLTKGSTGVMLRTLVEVSKALV